MSPRLIITTLICIGLTIGIVYAGKAIGPLYFELASDNVVPKYTFYPGESVYLIVTPRGSVSVRLTVEVVNPMGVTVTPLSDVVLTGVEERKYRIFQVDPSSPTGTYTVVIRVTTQTGWVEDQLSFSVASTTPPPPPPPDEWLKWLVVAAVVGIAVIGGIVAAVLLRRRQPPTVVGGPPISIPPSPPQPTPAPTAIAMPKTEVGVPLAYLVLPSGQQIPIMRTVEEFGRDKFVGYIPPEQAQYISARHFRIMHQAGRWFIEDLNSTNGTIVDGQQIKGKGLVEIRKGSVISPAGVITLKFLPAETEVYKG